LFSEQGGHLVSAEEIVLGAMSSRDEGLTLLGGEPLDQLTEVTRLASLAQSSGLGVICFTGHELASLERDENFGQLSQQIDVLVDGPYRADIPELSRSLVGSANQRFIFFTDRYTESDFTSLSNRLELEISSDGTVSAAGFARTDRVANLAMQLDARRKLK
jgi:anaerobic ribonucleoside-triphosphate reductase activating protein